MIITTGTNAGNCVIPEQQEFAPSAAEKLPPEMFYKIFQKLDKKSLMNSREVCTTWRNAIDNDPKLLQLFTFIIVDIEEFLDSQLASKVKSVRFIQSLKGTEKALEEFFTKIGSTAEEVFLDFKIQRPCSSICMVQTSKTETERRKLMLSMVLQFCLKLKSLTITSEDNNYDFLENCGADPRNYLGLSLVQRLSVNVRAQPAYLGDLRKLVLNLPNLHYLDFNCSDFELLGF